MKELLFKTLWTILFRVILGIKIKHVSLEKGTHGKVRKSESRTIYLAKEISFVDGHKVGNELRFPISTLIWHEYVHTLQYRGYSTQLSLPPRAAFYADEYLYTDRDEAEAEAFAFIMTGYGLDLHCVKGVEWLIEAYQEFLSVPQYARLLKRGKITLKHLHDELWDFQRIEEYFPLWEENQFRQTLGEPEKYIIPMVIEYLINSEKGFYYECGRKWD